MGDLIGVVGVSLKGNVSEGNGDVGGRVNKAGYVEESGVGFLVEPEG